MAPYGEQLAQRNHYYVLAKGLRKQALEITPAIQEKFESAWDDVRAKIPVACGGESETD